MKDHSQSRKDRQADVDCKGPELHRTVGGTSRQICKDRFVASSKLAVVSDILGSTLDQHFFYIRHTLPHVEEVWLLCDRNQTFPLPLRLPSSTVALVRFS